MHRTRQAPAVELKEKAVTPVPDKEPVVMPPVVPWKAGRHSAEGC